MGDLQYAETSRLLPNGTAEVHWERTGARFTLSVEVPASTTAEVWVPTTGGRRAVVVPKRATFQRIEGDYAVYSVGAGGFEFVSAPVK